MRKIIMSVLAIVLAVGTVSGAAYAVFNSQVQVKGITLATGNADLDIAPWTTPNQDWQNDGAWLSGLLWGEALDVTGYWNPLDPQLHDFEREKMYPGFGQGQDKFFSFALKNNSGANFGMDLAAQIPNGGVVETTAGAWGVLSGVVKLMIVETGGYTSGWHTLAQWNSTPQQISNTALPQGSARGYKMYVMVDSGADNGIADAKLSGVKVNLVGTQVTP